MSHRKTIEPILHTTLGGQPVVCPRLKRRRRRMDELMPPICGYRHSLS